MSETDPEDEYPDVARAMESRDRYRRGLRRSETPAERLKRFRELQIRAFQTLRESPSGWAHFLRRNYRKRRMKRGNDGVWRPVTDP